jgi:hypothetical protein
LFRCSRKQLFHVTGSYILDSGFQASLFDTPLRYSLGGITPPVGLSGQTGKVCSFISVKRMEYRKEGGTASGQ